ncbi:hypothetical protein ACFWIA_27735 [Streptomyces sp. NPDC127068]|uniref:hypothetical protein n=1 Tax=Streptomyces sp. NPDC127068 TaxID=3347127 RepID=UPI0036624628
MGAVLLGVAGVVPAHAEGSFSSYISAWQPGDESRRWTDGNRDSVKTSVRFRGCESDGGGGFRKAQLKLWRDVFGPDKHQGTRTNTCKTATWKDVSKGTYYFELWGVWNGSFLWVDSVTTKY